MESGSCVYVRFCLYSMLYTHAQLKGQKPFLSSLIWRCFHQMSQRFSSFVDISNKVSHMRLAVITTTASFSKTNTVGSRQKVASVFI